MSMSSVTPRRGNNTPSGSVRGIYEAIETFRRLDPTAGLLLIQTFLAIATARPKEYVGCTEITKRLGVPSPTAVHNISRLERGRPRRGGEGLGLIAARAHPTDGRRESYELTAAGRDLIRRMRQAMRAA
jgi:DNA-binding MarR family transcriptional regulator